MIISTDSTANLPKHLYTDLNINMIPLQIYLDGEIYDDLSPNLPLEDFYKKMKAGSVPKTAQINEATAREYFEKLLSKNEDIIHISFSSALSGNTPTIIRIANELNKNNKNKIHVIDSLNASMGEGLLVLLAYNLKKQGKSINEIVEIVTKARNHTCSFFTVEQLKYLVKGGRINKLKGMVGSLLNIKPILKVDKTGRLVEHKKVIARKKSICELANTCANKIKDKSYVYICHAVCEDEANDLAFKIEKLVGTKPIITDLTQVIGSHTGPGLLSVFFFDCDTKSL